MEKTKSIENNDCFIEIGKEGSKMFQELFDGLGKLILGALIIFLIIFGLNRCTIKEPKIEFALSHSDIKGFKADPSNVVNYSSYGFSEELGFISERIMKLVRPDYEEEKKKSLLPDVNNNLHKSAISLTVDPEGQREPYIILKLKNVKGGLESFSSFKGTLSIVPEEEFYKKSVSTVKSTMNFYFINEREEILGQYTIDSQNALPFEFELKKSKELYVVAETDYKELFVGAILSPELTEN